MTILDRIVHDKRKEVALKASIVSIKQLETTGLFSRETYSLSERIKNSHSGIIAEHKRRSPSKSVINHSLNVQDVAKGYEDAG
ncbi:MAG: indole-3-glycerol-phosphate synthase TrpC, partial [Bacteroidota bacterium]